MIFRRLFGAGGQQKKNPSVPSGLHVFAVGDIHGRLDLLQEVHAKIDAHSARVRLPQAVEIYLGDYIDRGRSSRQVIDCLLTRSANRQVVLLGGNHELYPLEFCRTPQIFTQWTNYGGKETLESYGITSGEVTPAPEELEKLAFEFAAALPISHRRFFTELLPYYVCGDFFFVHAGVRPGVALDAQSPDDLLWIREEFLEHEEDFGKIIVHGHTPVQSPEFKPNRINIDTGAYLTGRLSCLAIAGDTCSIL